MRRFPRLLAMGAVVAVAALAVPATAAHIDLTAADMTAEWPEDGFVNTGDPFDGVEPDYSGERDVKQSRQLVQSFQLDEDALITDFFVAYQNPVPNEEFQVRIYDMADVFAGVDEPDVDPDNNPALGTELYMWTVTTPADVPAADGEHHVLRLSLDVPIVLQAKDAPSGYAFMLFRGEESLVFQWLGERDIDAYAEGRAFSDSPTSWTEGTDFSLAIVPEPASLSILAGGGLLVLLRRRR